MAKYDIYTISQPEPGHYRILSPAAVYMELFVGTERALLLDTGFGFGDLKGAVRSITDLPLVIVCTHGHSDHTFGNGLFTEPVYLDERDMDLFDEGLFDSMAAIELLVAIEEEFGVLIAPTEVEREDMNTVNLIIARVAERM